MVKVSPSRCRSRTSRGLVAALLVLLAAAPIGAAPPPAGDTVEGWRASARGLHADAVARWRDRATPTAAERLDAAVAALAVPPLTSARAEAARAAFTKIAAARDADAAVAATAHYHLARLHQLHDRSPDLPAAIRHYRAAWELAPDATLPQLGVARLTLLELHGRAPDDPALRARFDTRAALAEHLTHPVARRDLHVVLGHVARRLLEDPALALHHYEAAAATGLVGESLGGELLFHRALLHEQLGQLAAAAARFREFAALRPRDPRRPHATERAAALAAGAAPASSP